MMRSLPGSWRSERKRRSASAQRLWLGIGAGLDQIEVGARLRYEIRREFAPNIGIEQSWRTGRGADFARLRGEDPSATSLVAGIRFWF